MLGVNYSVTKQADPLADDLRLRLPAKRKLMPVDVTDPYSLLLVRTADVVPLAAVPAITESEQPYRLLYGLVPGGRPDADAWPTAVFSAERSALRYEQQLGRELRQMARVLHPLVVTGLNDPDRARAYALGYAANWVRRLGPEIWVQVPGFEPFTLVTDKDQGDPLHPVVLGFIRFAALTSDADAEFLSDAVASASREIEELWRRWTRPDWKQVAADLLRSGGVEGQDLAALVALIVREELRKRVARR